MKDYSFQVAGGSMVGRDHIGRNGLLIGKNNQDAFAFRDEGDFIAAVVCDGCGTEPHSEVGSKIAVRLMLAALERRIRQRGGLKPDESAMFWEGVRRDVLAEIRVLAKELAGTGSTTEAISHYFLFSTLILLITPTFTEIVGIGDGVYAINGQISELKPEEGNKPLYMAYELVDSEFSKQPERLRFTLHRRIPTTELRSAMIGTDGLSHFISNAHRPLPGWEELIGEISQFWSEDRYFKNSDAIRRRLAVTNGEIMQLDKSRRNVITATGPLADDTTLVVVRRAN